MAGDGGAHKGTAGGLQNKKDVGSLTTCPCLLKSDFASKHKLLLFCCLFWLFPLFRWSGLMGPLREKVKWTKNRYVTEKSFEFGFILLLLLSYRGIV